MVRSNEVHRNHLGVLFLQIKIYIIAQSHYSGLREDRLNCLPASLSFWSFLLDLEYRIQFAWYSSEIVSRNVSLYNIGVSSVWPVMVKVILSTIAHPGVVRTT